MKRLLKLFTKQIPRSKKVGRGEVGSRSTKNYPKKIKNKLSQRLHLLKENQNLKFAPIK